MRSIGIFASLTLVVLLAVACSPAQSSEAATPTIQSQAVQISATPPATATSQVTATPIPFFTVYGDMPIVSKGQPGTWDERFTDPGAVVYDNGMFHMFRNGFREFPGESQVGYVTSPDGYTWTKQGDDPVFKTEDVPYAKIAMYASSVLRQGNCWVLYFYTWDSSSSPSASVIGRATECSGDPAMAEWIVDEEPVLRPGANGDWDEKQVLAPHVLKTETGYTMYYSGVSASGIPQIGMATSSDGVNWTKYNDETTTGKPYVESDPIFQPGEKGTWDANWVHQPRVFQTSNGWLMIYRGVSDAHGEKMKLGLAASKDGIHWERFAGNPVFEPTDIKGARYFWFTNAILKDDVLYLFVEGDIRQTTQIYLATHAGSVIP